MVVGARSVGAAAVAVAAVGALAWVAAAGGARGDGSPVGAARAFVAAARAADKPGVWELLGPATRARLRAAATAATEKVGGARRYAPLDVLDVTAPDSSYAPTEIIAREVRGDRAVVDVLGPDGHHDALELVSVDGRWRVEL